MRHVGEYSPAKTGEYPRIFPNFQNCTPCKKDLKDNKPNSLYLRRKYARIFVLGHYLFLVAHSFPPAMLSENCFLLGTDNVRGQNYSIFSHQIEAIVYLTYNSLGTCGEEVPKLTVGKLSADRLPTSYQQPLTTVF